MTFSSEIDKDRCKLAFEDGTIVTGVAIGHRGETGGEICFNTSMTGYQEIMTDPSYHGQIMMMTYPHIGNYGAADHDMEAGSPMIAGLVVRAYCERYSNFAAEHSLDFFMKRHQLVGISGVDTRTLVRHIREKGVMNAVISSSNLDHDYLIDKARNWPSMEGLELASRVSTTESFQYSEGKTHRIAVYDFGVKQNILRSFAERDCEVYVFSHDTPLQDVLNWNPDGIFFSNGPGDPRAMPDAIKMVGDAVSTGIPLFGICLGHQLMALSQGLSVYKMYVGHRGANHPVKNLDTGHVEVTTQNHGFAVEGDSLTGSIADLTHVNLNDQTVEGVRYARFRGLSVQYHPEASPGPHDSRYLFDSFLDLVSQAKTTTGSASVEENQTESASRLELVQD